MAQSTQKNSLNVICMYVVLNTDEFVDTFAVVVEKIVDRMAAHYFVSRYENTASVNIIKSELYREHVRRMRFDGKAIEAEKTQRTIMTIVIILYSYSGKPD